MLKANYPYPYTETVYLKDSTITARIRRELSSFRHVFHEGRELTRDFHFFFLNWDAVDDNLAWDTDGTKLLVKLLTGG